MGVACSVGDAAILLYIMLKEGIIMTQVPHWLTAGVHVPMWHVIAIVVISIVICAAMHYKNRR